MSDQCPFSQFQRPTEVSKDAVLGSPHPRTFASIRFRRLEVNAIDEFLVSDSVKGSSGRMLPPADVALQAGPGPTIEKRDQ